MKSLSCRNPIHTGIGQQGVFGRALYGKKARAGTKKPFRLFPHVPIGLYSIHPISVLKKLFRKNTCPGTHIGYGTPFWKNLLFPEKREQSFWISGPGLPICIRFSAEKIRCFHGIPPPSFLHMLSRFTPQFLHTVYHMKIRVGQTCILPETVVI